MPWSRPLQRLPGARHASGCPRGSKARGAEGGGGRGAGRACSPHRLRGNWRPRWRVRRGSGVATAWGRSRAPARARRNLRGGVAPPSPGPRTLAGLTATFARHCLPCPAAIADAGESCSRDWSRPPTCARPLLTSPTALTQARPRSARSPAQGRHNAGLSSEGGGGPLRDAL